MLSVGSGWRARVGKWGFARFYSPADFRASLAVDPESLDPAFPRTRRTNPVGMDPSSRSSARGWIPSAPDFRSKDVGVTCVTMIT